MPDVPEMPEVTESGEPGDPGRPDASRQVGLVLDLCLRVGEILLSSGAGAADVSVTMQAVAAHYGLRQPEVDVTFTSLAMSHQARPEDSPVMAIRTREAPRDRLRGPHPGRPPGALHLSSQCTLPEASVRLNRIVSSGHQRRGGR